MTTPEIPKPDPLKKFRPFVPENMEMKEFTLRAVVLGLVMCVVLGAANAYLGLKAGVTIAATYPAAVIGMAVLRLFKASVLEENIARTAGSIGESIAAAAIHKAGQRGGEAAKFLFINMGVGAFVYLMGVFQLFATDKKFFLSLGDAGRTAVRLDTRGAIVPFAV